MARVQNESDSIAVPHIYPIINMPPSSSPPRGFNPLNWGLHPITWCVLGMIALVGIGCGCLRMRQSTPPIDAVVAAPPRPSTPAPAASPQLNAEVHVTTTESDSAPDSVPAPTDSLANNVPPAAPADPVRANVPQDAPPVAPNIVHVPGPTNTVEVEKWRTKYSHSKETVYLPAPARPTTTSTNALANMNGDVHPGAIFAVAGGNVTIGYPPEHMAKLAESALARIPAFKTSAKVQSVMPGQAGVVLEKDQYASIEFPGNIGNFQIMAEETDIETSYDGLTALEAAGRTEGIQGTRRIMIRARKPAEVAFNW